MGLTQGTVAHEDYTGKHAREAHFPLAPLAQGVSFRCKEGETSWPADKQMILRAIGDDADQLDAMVHGRVAASALMRVLEATLTMCVLPL